MTAAKITSWYWFGDTQISSVAVASITGGASPDIVTGGSFFDGTRDVAQLIVWNSATMTAAGSLLGIGLQILTLILSRLQVLRVVLLRILLLVGLSLMVHGMLLS